jgi:hypothetical protein
MRRAGLIVLGLVLVAFVAGCASKPQKEIDETTAAVNAVISEGLGKYAPEDEKKLKDAMAAVNEELKVQEGKTIKNYDKTKQMLADTKKMADEMKAALPAKKEKAKQEATAALEAAKAALADANKALAKAPKGKGTAADIAAIRGDLKGAEEMVPEIQGLIEKEEYSAAVTKANALKEKAADISDQVQKAFEKVKAKKAPAKK